MGFNSVFKGLIHIFLMYYVLFNYSQISAYIKCRQLKSAYLLAVKYSRLEDVQKILHEAQKLGQTKIQQICLKRLGQHVET